MTISPNKIVYDSYLEFIKAPVSVRKPLKRMSKEKLEHQKNRTSYFRNNIDNYIFTKEGAKKLNNESCKK